MTIKKFHALDEGTSEDRSDVFDEVIEGVRHT
jgi:hypothetical protein